MAQRVYGSACKLLDYEVEKGPAYVEGFMSRLVKVKVQVSLQEKVYFFKLVQI